jgi:hypothetical protein
MPLAFLSRSRLAFWWATLFLGLQNADDCKEKKNGLMNLKVKEIEKETEGELTSSSRTS